ncbi:MAG: tetratricopeptide repeat protein, partial [Acidobacteriota bacterium]
SYLASKFIRRHRGPALAGVSLVLVLVAGIVTTSWQARVARAAQERAEQRRAEAEEQREIAELQGRRAEEAAVFLVDLFDVSDPFRTEGERQGATARELLDRGAERIAGGFDEDPLLRAALMATIGRVYRNMTLLDESEALLVKALELRRRSLSPEAEEVLDSLRELADLRLDQERFREAEQILEQLAAERRRLGDAPALAATLENLAVAKRGLDLTADAEALLAEALELREGEGDELAVAHLKSLQGQMLRRQNDPAKAEQLLREVLEVRRRELGDDHPLVALTLNDIALVLQGAGDLDAAGELFREVLEIYRKTVGDRSHHVVSATLNLAANLIYSRCRGNSGCGPSPGGPRRTAGARVFRSRRAAPDPRRCDA